MVLSAHSEHTSHTTQNNCTRFGFFESGADIKAACRAQEIIHKNIQEQGTQVPFFKK